MALEEVNDKYLILFQPSRKRVGESKWKALRMKKVNLKGTECMYETAEKQ